MRGGGRRKEEGGRRRRRIVMHPSILPASQPKQADANGSHWGKREGDGGQRAMGKRIGNLDGIRWEEREEGRMANDGTEREKEEANEGGGGEAVFGMEGRGDEANGSREE
jgi:hypothetical protein